MGLKISPQSITRDLPKDQDPMSLLWGILELCALGSIYTATLTLPRIAHF